MRNAPFLWLSPFEQFRRDPVRITYDQGHFGATREGMEKLAPNGNENTPLAQKPQGLCGVEACFPQDRQRLIANNLGGWICLSRALLHTRTT